MIPETGLRDDRNILEKVWLMFRKWKNLCLASRNTKAASRCLSYGLVRFYHHQCGLAGLMINSIVTTNGTG